MKVLTVSDKMDELVYSSAIQRLFGDVDLVLGCGDLPHHYLEFIVTMLGGPLFYVIGNHGVWAGQPHFALLARTLECQPFTQRRR